MIAASPLRDPPESLRVTYCMVSMHRGPVLRSARGRAVRQNRRAGGRAGRAAARAGAPGMGRHGGAAATAASAVGTLIERVPVSAASRAKGAVRRADGRRRRACSSSARTPTAIRCIGGRGNIPDNARRFAVLVRAALEFVARRGPRPSVVHAHDWQAGLALVYPARFFARRTRCWAACRRSSRDPQRRIRGCSSRTGCRA